MLLACVQFGIVTGYYHLNGSVVLKAAPERRAELGHDVSVELHSIEGECSYILPRTIHHVQHPKIGTRAIRHL